jgi:hypothetical protein
MRIFATICNIRLWVLALGFRDRINGWEAHKNPLNIVTQGNLSVLFIRLKPKAPKPNPYPLPSRLAWMI